MDIDEVREEGAIEPQPDVLGGAAEGAPPPGPRRGDGVPREELELRRAGCERGELDGEPLHRAGGRRPREPGRARRAPPLPIGARLPEGRLDQPRRALLQLRARPRPPPPPP